MHETFTFRSLDADRDYLLNKYHRTDEAFDSFRRFNYHGYEYDPTTGLTDEQISEVISTVITIGASVWAWWENNSFTKNAIEADKVLDELTKKDKEQ